MIPTVGMEYPCSEKNKMERKIIPCAEGDDKFVAERLNAFTDSKTDLADTIEDELVVFKVTDCAFEIRYGDEDDAEYTVYKYRCDNGRTGRARPWKRG